MKHPKVAVKTSSIKMEPDEQSLENSNVEGLRKRLIEEHKFLTKLVDAIPAKVYFDDDIQEKIIAEKHSMMDQNANELKRSFGHQELSVKSKHKRARLDPLWQKSVSQIHEELDKKKKKPKKNHTSQSVSITRASNIEELQKRLQEKISEFQGKRKTSEGSISAKQRLKKKQRKNKAKQKGNMAKSENKKTENVPPKVTTEDKKKQPKPMFNKDKNVIFSKFDFIGNGGSERERGEFSGKKNKKLLFKAEKEKEKIEELKQTDSKKAEVLIKKAAWKRAIQKSEGVKVRDDVNLIKKTMKRLEEKKNKSVKEWTERKNLDEKKKQFKQDKRARNIKQRKQDKLKLKIKRAKKKGRVIPGF